MDTLPQLQTTSVTTQNETIRRIEEFQKRQNKAPSKVESSQGFETVPISTLENELDEEYAGLWQTENFRWQVIANEIVGSIDLLVYHPVVGMWLKKTGSASVMIQQDAGAAIEDIGKKKKNALIKDFPKLEIMCIKSAAKKLGAKYGRNLNRKWIDQYETQYTNEIESNEAIFEIAQRIQKSVNLADLMKIYAEYPDLHQNSHFKKYFTQRRTELQTERERADGVLASCTTKKELQAFKNQIGEKYPDMIELIDKKMEEVK